VKQVLDDESGDYMASCKSTENCFLFHTIKIVQHFRIIVADADDDLAEYRYGGHRPRINMIYSNA